MNPEEAAQKWPVGSEVTIERYGKRKIVGFSAARSRDCLVVFEGGVSYADAPISDIVEPYGGEVVPGVNGFTGISVSVDDVGDVQVSQADRSIYLPPVMAQGLAAALVRAADAAEAQQ